MAERQFVLRIDAGPGTNRMIKEITAGLNGVANGIANGSKLVGQGTVRGLSSESIGSYKFEDIHEPSPSATQVAQRWQKLREAIRFQDVLARKNGNINRIQAIGEIQDIMELIEEGKI